MVEVVITWPEDGLCAQRAGALYYDDSRERAERDAATWRAQGAAVEVREVVSVLNYEGAEFLSDPCIIMGCCLHYGHDGEHILEEG
jgi:hypothetical protein